MDLQQKIAAFLESEAFGVVGASADRAKYGNKVLRAYLQKGRAAWPVNPREAEIEGRPCYPDVTSLPDEVAALSIITPPPVTDRVVDEALGRGLRHFWMQPGAESPDAVERAELEGANVIHGGPCLLVVLGYREQPAR